MIYVIIYVVAQVYASIVLVAFWDAWGKRTPAVWTYGNVLFYALFTPGAGLAVVYQAIGVAYDWLDEFLNTPIYKEE